MHMWFTTNRPLAKKQADWDSNMEVNLSPK